MLKATQELVNKFQQEHEVYIDAQDLESYWVITARIPKKQQTLHHVHYAQKFVTSRSEKGSVLIVVNPDASDAYIVENWGEMDMFDDFVKKALVRIRENRDAAGEGVTGDCGTSCS
jgi:hypothetical protein